MFSSLSSMPKLLFAGFIALCLTSCLSTPGKGWKANSGYRAATPVIAALEKFHNDHSRYPTNLVELLPVYIPDAEAFLAIKTITPVSPYTPTWEKSADQKQKYTSPGNGFRIGRKRAATLSLSDTMAQVYALAVTIHLPKNGAQLVITSQKSAPQLKSHPCPFATICGEFV